MDRFDLINGLNFNRNMVKKKKWANYLVGILVIGLVGAYVPLLFTKPQPTPPQEPYQNLSQNQTFSTSAETTSSQTAEEKNPPPTGFFGLENENELLDNLDQQLKNH
jgi:hypothetical protein